MKSSPIAGWYRLVFLGCVMHLLFFGLRSCQTFLPGHTDLTLSHSFSLFLFALSPSLWQFVVVRLTSVARWLFFFGCPPAPFSPLPSVLPICKKSEAVSGGCLCWRLTTSRASAVFSELSTSYVRTSVAYESTERSITGVFYLLVFMACCIMWSLRDTAACTSFCVCAPKHGTKSFW